MVNATSTSSGARGPLELPRARPLGARIVDEAWLAWSDQATMVRPVAARGLAWIDPRQVPGLLAAGERSSSLRESLAWRWTAETASRAKLIASRSSKGRAFPFASKPRSIPFASTSRWTGP